MTNGCAFKTTNHSQGLSAFSEEEKMYTEVRKRLLMGYYKFMSRDNSLKRACVSLTFLELVQKKSIPYFELWPFVLSNRGYAWLLHLPFAQQTLLLFKKIFFFFSGGGGGGLVFYLFLFLKGQFVGICSC